MSTSKETDLAQAYVELNKFCQNGDYQKALKAANKVLQIDGSEQKAFHCKVVCYINLHDFKEALQQLTNPKNSVLAAPLIFEKAYIQYRLNNLSEALKIIDGVSEQTPALKELRAQILYKLEKYDDCYNLYRDIVKTTSDDYEDERKANMAAVVSCIAAINPESNDLPEIEGDTYELSYNRACTDAMRGKYSNALQSLKKAEQECISALVEDGSTEEEAKEESTIIRIQQAYCLQMLGKEKEASAIYQTILKEKPSDQALLAIASNNMVVINRDTNVFDSKKRMKAATAEGLEHKLNSRQRATITYNQAILAIFSNQPDFCKQCCVKLAKEFKMETKAVLVEACSLVKENKTRQAVELLTKHGGQLKLAALHLLLTQGERKDAISLVESSEFKFKPAIIGLLVTLLCANNETDRALKLFDEAFEHYKNDKSETLSELWSGAASLASNCGDSVRARKAREAQVRLNPDDPKAIARLLKAMSLEGTKVDLEAVKKLATRLPPIAQLEGKIDVEALESSNWMMGAKVVKKAVKQEGSPGTPGTEGSAKKTEKKKRKRKTILPPTADLSKPADPERWLPKYERAAYRKKKANPRQAVRGPQGMAAANASDAYDMSKQQPSSAGSAKSPRVEQKSSGESAWQRKQQQKKGKGKGKRW